jgi:hypothetical protein
MVEMKHVAIFPIISEFSVGRLRNVKGEEISI